MNRNGIVDKLRGYRRVFDGTRLDEMEVETLRMSVKDLADFFDQYLVKGEPLTKEEQHYFKKLDRNLKRAETDLSEDAFHGKTAEEKRDLVQFHYDLIDGDIIELLPVVQKEV